MTERIIIDTDPGVDDALAILMALGSSELQVEALTTVFGNVDVESTTRNALTILAAAERLDVPVYAGAARPLSRPLGISSDYVHGVNGLGDSPFPAPTASVEAEAACFYLARRLAEPNGPRTLVTLGPLTNLALALHLNPSIATALERVVCMGGAVWTHGNITVSAESNIFKDPEAADVVFASGVPLVLVPLDVTMRTLLLHARLDEAVMRSGKLGAFINGITPRYFEFYKQRYGLDGFALHDPCTIAYLINPELFETQQMAMAVETGGTFSTGRTVPDTMGRLGRTASIQACLNVREDELVELTLERLANAGR